MGKVLERINGARIITAVFYDERQTNGGLGYIDFVDDRWGKPRHRFAFIDSKDWEKEIKDRKLPNGAVMIESRLSIIKTMLNEALMNDNKIDIVVERRQTTPKQQFDFLVKVEGASSSAFQG